MKKNLEADRAEEYTKEKVQERIRRTAKDTKLIKLGICQTQLKKLIKACKRRPFQEAARQSW